MEKAIMLENHMGGNKAMLILLALIALLFAVVAWLTGEPFTSSFSEVISTIHKI